jgi:hypothetical protein
MLLTQSNIIKQCNWVSKWVTRILVRRLRTDRYFKVTVQTEGNQRVVVGAFQLRKPHASHRTADRFTFAIFLVNHCFHWLLLISPCISRGMWVFHSKFFFVLVIWKFQLFLFFIIRKYLDIMMIWYCQGCSLGLDVSVSRRSRDLFLKCLGLVSSRKFCRNVSSRSRLGYKVKCLGLVSVSDMKVSFTVNIMLNF